MNFLPYFPDEDVISNRAKRSPIFPGYDVVQYGAFKLAKKKAKKKFKKLLIKSPFIALKGFKKKLKFVPPLAFAGAASGGTLAAPLAGLGGAAGALGPALAGLGGGGGAAAALPGALVTAAELFPAAGVFSGLAG